MKRFRIYIFILLSPIFVSCSQEKKEDHRGHSSGKENAYIYRPVNKFVISDQKLIQPTIEKPDNIRINGYVTFDPRRNNKIAARIGGRVERLYYKYDYQFLSKGEKVLEIYSPELNTYQEEYLFLIKSTNEQKLIEQGRNKLRLLGLTNSQIDNLEKNGIQSITIPVYSNYEGYILFNTEPEVPVSNNAPSVSNEMGNATVETGTTPSTDMAPSNKERLREGMYVGKGQLLFSVNDFNTAWIILSIEPQYFSLVKEGQSVNIKSELFLDTIRAKINYIEPIYKNNQKFLQVRVYLPNPEHRLKGNSLVTARIDVPGKSILTVPNSAIYDLGKRKIVWVYKGDSKDGHKILQATQVKTGTVFEDRTEIEEGLTGREKVAENAGYLNDSESLIQTK